MHAQPFYFDRDLSWLSFNGRILAEAGRPEVPLPERVKFAAIAAGNLDEFSRVRLSSIRQLAQLRKRKLENQLVTDPRWLQYEVQKAATRQVAALEETVAGLLDELAETGLVVYRSPAPLPGSAADLTSYFRSRVLCFLQPVFLGKKAPDLMPEQLYLALKLRSRTDEGVTAYALLNVPTDRLPRLTEWPCVDGKRYFLFLDDLVRHHLPLVFPYHQVLACHSVKLGRDEELSLEDEYADDLAGQIKAQLAKQQTASPVRFCYDRDLPGDLLDQLVHTLELSGGDLVPAGRYLNWQDLHQLPVPGRGGEARQMRPLRKKELDACPSLLACIRQGDVLLHYPYHPYDYVLKFFNEAAVHPDVREIKVSLYRVAKQSCIANALITAARNSKKVTAFVEVKARFDEAHNLYWAEEMERAGVRVRYGLPGLKVHAKLALVKASGPDGQPYQYAYLSTGNFNENTARFYVDSGFFTAHPEVTAEVDEVFRYLAKGKTKSLFRHLLVAPFDMQAKLLALIDQEIENARSGQPAGLVIKVNNLEDPVLINKLYEAGRAGVPVTLLVRSICCLVLGRPGWSDNVRVIHLVDGYLEHARVYRFEHGGNPALYLSSADWMGRNLNRRVEVAFPVYDPSGRAELEEMLRLQAADNVQAVRLDQHLQNLSVERKPGEPVVRAQRDFYMWLLGRERPAEPAQMPEEPAREAVWEAVGAEA
jgi:polyphosphate kinase